MLCAVTSFVTCAHDPTSSYTQKPASDEVGVVDRANQACFLFCFVFVVPACPLKEMQNEISPNISPLWTTFSRPFLPTAHLKCWLSVQRFGSTGCFFVFFSSSRAWHLKHTPSFATPLTETNTEKGMSTAEYTLCLVLIWYANITCPPPPPPHPSFMWV